MKDDQRAAVQAATRDSRGLLSIVVPAYNEAEGLPELHRRLSAVLDGVDLEAEILYVNDGSRDATLAVMEDLHRQDSRVGIVDLSRNFGKEIAMTAGLDLAGGDAVVVIDADLQDPPELIPELIRHWRAGHDVVYAKREFREGETWIKRATAHLFYRLIRLCAGRTVITIAHRLSTIRNATRIIVLAGGRLVEEGDFATLSTRGGAFARLVAAQNTGDDTLRP